MKVLVTGGAGFIGSHLVEALLAEGKEVIVLDNLSTGSLRNIEHLKKNSRFHFVLGSILDPEALAPLVAETELIYHLAAAVGVRFIVQNPVATLVTNVRGTENVLESAERLGKKKVILASTSEVYGKGAKFPFREDDDSVIGPTTVSRWGYACSKSLDEFLALAYYREKGLPVVILRLFNTVGARQTGHYGMVLPRFVEQALRGEQITVYGDGEQLRSFTYVQDVVGAMSKIARVKEAEGEVFNVGSNGEISINELAALVKKTLKSDSPIVHLSYEQAYGQGFEDLRRRLPDISKLRKYIDYRPNTSLAQIVQEIAEDMKQTAPRAKA